MEHHRVRAESLRLLAVQLVARLPPTTATAISSRGVEQGGGGRGGRASLGVRWAGASPPKHAEHECGGQEEMEHEVRHSETMQCWADGLSGLSGAVRRAEVAQVRVGVGGEGGTQRVQVWGGGGGEGGERRYIKVQVCV